VWTAVNIVQQKRIRHTTYHATKHLTHNSESDFKMVTLSLTWVI